MRKIIFTGMAVDFRVEVGFCRVDLKEKIERICTG
jgi:hypothetical protein